MAHDLFIFVKSFKDRLDEFNYILNNSLTAAVIKREWSTFVEFTIEPVGWRAIWKISRDLCTDLKINFPCTVIVTVQQVNFKELSCTVSINEVEDDNVCLPQMMADIPLIELYPTIEQDNNFLLSKLSETAKVIDSLRTFYNHLWMPWDVDYDDCNPWVTSHLEGRLKLHFALLERQVPNDVAHAVRKLVAEGRKIQKEIEVIQDQLSEEMEVDGFSTRLLELMELHNRMSALKNQYRIYEKPELLKAFIQRTQSTEKNKLENENCESVTFVVLNKCTPEQLTRLGKMTSESKLLRMFQTLQETLIKVPANASICMLQGRHPVHDLGNLEIGGTIKGLEPGVEVTEDEDSPIGWSLLEGCLTLTNLTVRMSSVWNIIKVRPGAELVLQDVTLEGASVTDAVDVFPGAKLVATNCHFSNCRTAVVCDTTSTVVLQSCTFTDNKVAIEVKEGGFFTMENCTISNSSMYGVNVVLAQRREQQSESFDSVTGLKASDTTFKSNAVDYHFDSPSLKLTDNNHDSDCGNLSASR